MARMQWADEGRGNRNPHVVVNDDAGLSPIILRVKAGESVRMDASRSFDPDGDALSFLWWQQPEIGTAVLTIADADKSAATVRIPADATGQNLHLVCEVHDQGTFHLVAYRRVILNVQ